MAMVPSATAAVSSVLWCAENQAALGGDGGGEGLGGGAGGTGGRAGRGGGFGGRSGGLGGLLLSNEMSEHVLPLPSTLNVT